MVPAKAPTPEPLESPEPQSPPRSAPRETLPSEQPQPQPTANAPNATNGEPGPEIARNGDMVDSGDDGSSSLSEPEESIEDRDEAALRTRASPDVEDNDSEAETERLEGSPPELSRTATDVTVGGEGDAGRSPSKLARATTAEHNNEAAAPAHSATVSELSDNDDDDALLPDAKPDAEADREDSPNGERKRKRSSSALSSIDDEMDIDQPARKRSNSSRHYDVNGDEAEAKDGGEHAAEDEEQPPKEADTHAEDEDMAEPASEAPAVNKKSKSKKGQKKGKRTRANTDVEEAAATPVEAEEEETGDVEMDAEEAGVIEEERKCSQRATGSLNANCLAQVIASTMRWKLSTRLKSSF